MSVTQDTNIFNQFLLNPFLNRHYPCIYNNPQLTFENKVNKSPIININKQINPISQFNYLNFPIFLNNNNVNLPEKEKNTKNCEGKNQCLNGINIININYNLLNGINNNLSSPTSVSSIINDNSLNNLKNFQNITNNNYISNAFKKNYNINFFNDFLNLKEFPIPLKLNNKNNITTNEINDFLDEMTFSFESKANSKINSSKKNLFKLESQSLKKKRGRASIEKKNKTNRIHSSIDFDNILRKLQVHYLSFIIHFSNEILDNFYPEDKNYRFLNLSYGAKKNVKHSYVEQLKNSKIKDILILPPSPKYKIHNNYNINKEIYTKISESNLYLKDFFETNFLELFNKYYIKDSKKFIFNGKEICFNKTSFFCDLLKANQFSAKKIEQIAKSQFCEKNSTFFVV